MEVKSCDGIYTPNEKNVTLNMYFDKKKRQLSFKIVDSKDHVYESMNLIKSKLPHCTTDTFSVMGRTIFRTDTTSISRFMILKEFLEDKLNSYTSSSENYIGEMKDNMPHGHGTYFYKNTDDPMIIGQFVEGKPNGMVSLYSIDQDIELICDDICNDVPVSYGNILFVNKNVECNFEFKNFFQKHKNIHFSINNVNSFIHNVAEYCLTELDVKNKKEFLHMNKNDDCKKREEYRLLQIIDANQQRILTAQNKMYKKMCYFAIFLFFYLIFK